MGVFRCLPVPGDRILSAPRHRLLPDPALHPEPARRHPVVGVVLDQRGRESGARVYRSADGPHVHDAVHWRQRVASARQLRQGHRRLDVRHLEVFLIQEGVWSIVTSGCLELDPFQHEAVWNSLSGTA